MNPGRSTTKRPKIRVYNPHRLKANELEESFIARQDLFRSILSDVAAGRVTSAPQHHLVIGQRGMGKTTLLRRLALELHREPYGQYFLPLNFAEDQYIEVDRLSKFWLNCLDSMADALEHEGRDDAAQQIDEVVNGLSQRKTDETTYQEECRDAFSAAWKPLGRRPVLFVDNFNLLLARLRTEDFALRGYFSASGAPVLVAASTIYPKELEDYGAAFYDGFKPHFLHPLTLDEVRDVLVHLAHASDQPGLVDRIYQEQPRLAALRDLTGGNPRTAVMLFELFADGFSEDAFEDLEALLDLMTPLYQSRLDQLSDLAQTIVGTLARNWRPLTKAEIVSQARLVDSSVPPQLGRLRDIGLVEETEVFPSRKTGYQIAERFFNIWYLMRFTSRRQRASLACLTRFLEEFHTPAERTRSAHELLSRGHLSQGNITYAMALAGALGDEPALARELEWKAQLELIQQMDGVRERIAAILDPDDIQPGVYSFAELKQRLVQAVPDDSPVPGQQFAELVLGSLSMLPGGVGKAVQYDRGSLAGKKLSAADVAKLVEELEAETRTLSERFSADAVHWLRGRLNAGTLISWQDAEGLSRLMLLAEDSPAMRIARKFGHPDAKRKLSEPAFEKLVTAFRLRPSQGATAGKWSNWGDFLTDEFGRHAEAEQAYRQAIRLDPNYKTPWNNLGTLLQSHLGRYAEAEQAYREAIRLDPKSALPWCNLGALLQEHLGRYAEAEQAYREAIRLDPKSAMSWYNLGTLLHDYLGRHAEAEQAYRRALEIDPEFDWSRHNLASLLRDIRGEFAEAHVLLAELRQPDVVRDTQALHEALFAAYEDHWEQSAAAIRSALSLINDRLPPDTRDDWFRASAVLLHLGFGERLVALLEQSGADVTLLPWFAAVRAHALGDRRHLLNLPVEARPSAEQIFDEINRRRQQLPPRLL